MHSLGLDIKRDVLDEAKSCITAIVVESKPERVCVLLSNQDTKQNQQETYEF